MYQWIMGNARLYPGHDMRHRRHIHSIHYIVTQWHLCQSSQSELEENNNLLRY